MFISPQTFHQQKNPIFGRTNPEKMCRPFWEMMVQSKQSAYEARVQFRVDDYLASPDSIWSFDRCGATETPLPDGRVVYIAGEHEDHQGPDFCIYNDVVVVAPDGNIMIYGYPRHVFQPCNFHTATLISNSVLIVGNLGYYSERQINKTPVYLLDLRSLAIEEVFTTGDNPGWIFDHQAELDSTCTKLLLWSGEIIRQIDHKQVFSPNQHEYQLDLTTRNWDCISKIAIR